jgi:uncharacterized BrkB/YihY/UPF0761 family membrane protein
MDYYFWGNLFEYFRERRTAGVFFGTLLVFFGTILTVVVLHQTLASYDLTPYWPLLLPVVAVVALLPPALLWRWVRRRRARRLDRYQSSPLSRDEWVKARRKLAARPASKP